MKVGIIGFGFVGKALKNGLQENLSTYEVDPALNTNIDELREFSPDIIFICVPTPMNDDKTQDISILNNVIEELLEKDFKSLIVIKSTVLPLYINHIEQKLDSFIYNPEFLREKHANEDFINSNLLVLGGNKQDAMNLKDFYINNTKCICKDFIFTDSITASLIKYSINSFLATKVIFFNELKNVFDNSGSKDEWNNFIKYISTDERIGNSHMSVPGHDGKEGFGGACLPKDTSALYKYAESMGIHLSLIEKVIKLNNILRDKYNKDEREISQNIKYKE